MMPLGIKARVFASAPEGEELLDIDVVEVQPMSLVKVHDKPTESISSLQGRRVSLRATSMSIPYLAKVFSYSSSISLPDEHAIEEGDAAEVPVHGPGSKEKTSDSYNYQIVPLRLACV